MAAAVVINKAQLSKFVHKMGYAGTRGADHLRKRRLADVRKYRLGSAFLTKMGLRGIEWAIFGLDA